MKPTHHRIVLVGLVLVLALGQPSVAAASVDRGGVDVHQAGSSGQVAFATHVVVAEVGDVAAVPLDFTGTNAAKLTIGSKDLNWKVSMTVTDADDDGTATVQVDTDNVGHSGEVFSAAGTDEVSNVTVSYAPQFRNTSRRIAATAYPMSVSTGGTETDVASLALRVPTGPDRICNRSVDPLVEDYDANVDDLPWFLNGIVADATIHGIVNDDGSRNYTITTDSDRRVSDIGIGTPDRSSVAVETDCDTFRTIADAEDRNDAFGTAYDDGEIDIRGVGLVNSIVVGAVEIGYRIGRLLGLG